MAWNQREIERHITLKPLRRMNGTFWLMLEAGCSLELSAHRDESYPLVAPDGNSVFPMDHTSPSPFVLIAESALDDELITLRALARTEVPVRAEVERAGDAVIARFRTEFTENPPSLLLVSDGLLRVGVDDVVSTVRRIHDEAALPILHLRSGEERPIAEGASRWLVKPMGYVDYLNAVATTVTEMLVAR